jgi:dipeptidyl aminopeptidase/acylaminoacyl peptidase
MMWQMDGAGTPDSRIALPAAPDYGEPSYQRHGGQRWFVYDKFYVRELHAPFPNDRQFTELRAGSEGGQDVLLLSDPDLEIISSPDWAADDASITFIAERWELDGDGLPIAVDAGLYELGIDFTGGTPSAGALEFLADLSEQMRAGAEGFPPYSVAELSGHTWNNDAMRFAFGISIQSADEDAQEIWIADLSSGGLQLLVSGNVGWPEWSPDGRRIAYHNSAGQVVYDLATGRKKTLNSTPTASWGGLRWSPNSANVVVYHWDNSLPGYDAMYRFTSDLAGKTELTAGLANPLSPLNYFIPVGWRN